MNIFSKSKELMTKADKKAGKRIEEAARGGKPPKRARQPRKKAK